MLKKDETDTSPLLFTESSEASVSITVQRVYGKNFFA
jgi:hypothetical protein